MPVAPHLPHLDRMAAVAAAYDRAPVFDASAVPAWRALAADSVARAHAIGATLRVIETDNPAPYADASAMFDDLDRGRFVVSRANSEHPVWTVAENVAFRTVHDVLGHGATGGDFGWTGENLACAAHVPLLGLLARRALFTECIAQTGYAIARGGFGVQKVAIV